MKLEVINIQKKYGKKEILKEITFTAEAGQAIAILGVNGCGKSTLLSILAGVRKASGGSCLFDGEDLFKNSKKQSDVIGYVPQGTPLFEELTARDNLLLWYDKQDMERELENGVLKMLGIPAFLKTTVSNMSGGMKKRLSIGCAVAKKPSVLLLDEPSAALDVVCHENILAYLKEFKKSGGIVIICTHDSGDLPLCDTSYILKNGILTPYTYDGDSAKLSEMLQA